MHELIANAPLDHLRAAVCAIRYVGTRTKKVPNVVLGTEWTLLGMLRQLMNEPDPTLNDERVRCSAETLRSVIGAFLAHETPPDSPRGDLGADFYVMTVVISPAAEHQETYSDDVAIPRRSARAVLDAVREAIRDEDDEAREAIDRLRRATLHE